MSKPKKTKSAASEPKPKPDAKDISPELFEALYTFGDAMRTCGTYAANLPKLCEAIQKSLRDAYLAGVLALVEAQLATDGDTDRALGALKIEVRS